MKPIIFSTEMVRAILDDRKTQTRRVVKPQPPSNPDAAWAVTCPYLPGQTLWVRETWAPYATIDSWLDNENKYLYRADCSEEYTISAPPRPIQCSLCRFNKYDDFPCCVKWRPSIHMPREAARIFLRVKWVGMERLQELEDSDAVAEGVVYTDFGTYAPRWKASLDGGKTFHSAKPLQHNGWHFGEATSPEQCLPRARSAFARLWDRIYAKRGFPLKSNPFVWVVEFERIEKRREPCE